LVALSQFIIIPFENNPARGKPDALALDILVLDVLTERLGKTGMVFNENYYDAQQLNIEKTTSFDMCCET